MKKYLNKIRSILTINDDAIEYIEKDTKKVAKKTYKVIKNMALIFAYILIYVRLEGIVTYFESNKELNFSITKEGIEFDQGPKDKEKVQETEHIGAIREYVVNNELNVVTINDRNVDLDNKEQYNMIYGTDKNKIVITKEKVYIYENKMLRKAYRY